MKYLIDTHLLIWAVADSGKLSPIARRIFSDPKAECFYSAASIWEISIKRMKHPDKMPLSGVQARKLFLEAGFLELPITSVHAVSVTDLPDVHGDPFDRMLIAQAGIEGMTLVTHDAMVAKYGCGIIEV